MSKWVKTLACVGSLIGPSLYGWSNYNLSSNAGVSTEMVQNFPLNNDQQWFVTESYLIWKPYLEDIDYANHLSSRGSSSSNLAVKMKLEKPDFDWYSGARLGIGRYLANHDGWDISLFSTYFYCEETDHSNPNVDKGTFLTPTFLLNFSPMQKGSVLWRMNYFTWDLSIGREYSLLDSITAHPYLGLRGALIYQKYKTVSSDLIAVSTASIAQLGTFKANDTYWGIGPRAGADLHFYFKKNWSFLGGLSATLLYGHYDVKEIAGTVFTLSTSVGSGSFDILFNEKDARYCVRANVEGFFGLGWEAWVRNHTVRIAPSLLFEGSKWFGVNKFLNATALTTTGRHRGHLSLMGFSLNLQVDF